jgi:subtilisin family serine protease
MLRLCLPRPGRLRLPRRAGLLGLAGAAVLVVVAVGAGPAQADGVRDAQMWVLDAINAPAAWQVTQGQGVTVAVIDSGVEPDVSDLVGSVTTGPDFTGVSTPESNSNWGVHGTWMASLIAGHGHDGGSSGIIGVAPKSHVLSIRVITDSDDPGASRYEHEPQTQIQNELAEAISYAVSHGAGVISMSLGYGMPSLPVRSALQNALNHGVVIIASSGNSGDAAQAVGQGHAPYSFPADYPGVMGVAALSQSGAPAGFSSDNLSVQVAAPGVDVPAQGRDGQYWLVSGTSPACALTAGVAALIRSAYPDLPPDLVREAITTSTTDRPPGGYDMEVGFGTVDAAAALTAAAQLSAHGLVGPGAQPTTHASTSSHSVGVITPASSHSAPTAGISAASHFGGGPAAVPPPPVASRGLRPLVLFGALAVVCLAVIGMAMSRMLSGGRSPSPGAPALAGYRPGDATGGCGTGVNGAGGYAADGGTGGYGGGGNGAVGNGTGSSDPCGNGAGSTVPERIGGALKPPPAGGDTAGMPARRLPTAPSAPRFPWSPSPPGRHALPPNKTGTSRGVRRDSDGDAPGPRL